MHLLIISLYSAVEDIPEPGSSLREVPDSETQEESTEESQEDESSSSSSEEEGEFSRSESKKRKIDNPAVS